MLNANAALVQTAVKQMTLLIMIVVLVHVEWNAVLVDLLCSVVFFYVLTVVS